MFTGPGLLVIGQRDPKRTEFKNATKWTLHPGYDQRKPTAGVFYHRSLLCKTRCPGFQVWKFLFWNETFRFRLMLTRRGTTRAVVTEAVPFCMCGCGCVGVLLKRGVSIGGQNVKKKKKDREWRKKILKGFKAFFLFLERLWDFCKDSLQDFLLSVNNMQL